MAQNSQNAQSTQSTQKSQNVQNTQSSQALSEAEFDVLIVGAGLFGLTMAERLVNDSGKKVLLIDKRNHLGGNCYSEFDAETGIECHKYGAHLFHTSDERVWAYVNQFTKFTNYVHKVYTTHNNEVFPLPINLGTINQFFHAAYTPDEAKIKIAGQAADAPADPQNLAEQGISLIGKPLFDAFIKNYTAKQWQTPAEELSPDIIKRLPVRYNYDNRYFNNKYEGLPVDGYAAWFDNIIKSCQPSDALAQSAPVSGQDSSSQNQASSSRGSLEVRLETDYFTDPEIQTLRQAKILTIFTGPIDRFYDYQFGELKWRSLDLQKEVLDVSDFQGCPVMNYADLEPKYTRIHEFKHFHPERQTTPAESVIPNKSISSSSSGVNSLDSANAGLHQSQPAWLRDGQNYYAENSGKTVIVREYSKTWHRGEEPYYPVNTADDREKLARYQELGRAEANVIFGGRLGEYAYYDMDKTIASALTCYDNLKPQLS